jgi:uncharacterized membrane-anchored protein YjiN (DUF445 family)
MIADPDRAARQSLARYRAFATSLLGVMAGLIGLSYVLPQIGVGGWGVALLQASAKAGFVGGIADWFAITALFRHPLGLPIPHTAIIPRQKQRLGRALGRFVAGHVFTQEELSRTLLRLDLPGILRRFLSDPASTRPAAEALARMLPRLLATIDDGRARRTAARLIPRLVGGEEAGRIVGRALRGLMEGGRHQEVFSFILDELKKLLGEREEALRLTIEDRVREQGGRLIGWAVGATLARRTIAAVNAELARMETDGSDLRAAFDEWVSREIARIESEPARAAEIGLALKRVMTHETIMGWTMDIWSRLRLAIEADASRPNGRTVALIEGALANFGALLETDAGARTRLDQAAQGILGPLLPAAQMQMEGFIADVVGNWDTATITDRLELRVGKDLQYVRINGTLVGFLVGGVLWAILTAIFGHVAM